MLNLSFIYVFQGLSKLVEGKKFQAPVLLFHAEEEKQSVLNAISDWPKSQKLVKDQTLSDTSG